MSDPQQPGDAFHASTARKQADDALLFARFSLDSASDTIVCVDRDGRFVDVNDAFCRASGYSRDELLSMGVRDIDTDISDEFWRGFWEKLRQDGFLTFERNHRTREGKVYPVEIVATFFEFNGREYHAAFARDISARKRAEEEVRLTEERWRLALEGAGHGVFDENLLTGEVTLSPLYVAALGYTMEEFAALPHWSTRIHPDDVTAVAAARQAHLDGLTPSYLSERRLLCKDGSWKWIQLRGMVVARDAQGRPLRMIGTHTDISARKHAEEEARLADERWRLALEGADHGVWDEDLVSGRISFSRPYVESLGYTMEEFAGLVGDWKNRLHPEDLPAVMAARQAHLDGRTPRYQCERRMRCKDGSWKWIQTRGMVAQRDAQGRPLRMIGTHTDISERKKAEAELLASHEHIKALTQRLFTVQEEERLRLARTLHDDLAQSITATACLAQSLSLDLESRWREGFEQAGRIEQQLSDAVERTRLLSQGLLPLASRVGSISTALEHLARYASETYRIDCRFQSEPAGIEQTETVAEHLYYIAQEGVLNAVKHGQASAVTISLSLADAGSQPRLLVVDNGCGVNAVQLQANRGVGLHLMRERCRAIGMQMALVRNPAGGTILRVE